MMGMLLSRIIAALENELGPDRLTGDEFRHAAERVMEDAVTWWLRELADQAEETGS